LYRLWLLIEDALGIIVSDQGRYLQDIIHACEFLQNHIRHFHQYTLPDSIRLPEGNMLFETDHNDFRLPLQKLTRSLHPALLSFSFIYFLFF
jgi:hydrogenase large subunit